MCRILLILFLFFHAVRAIGAEPEPTDVPYFLIQNYTVDDYKASCQNWDLAVSYTGVLYVANNSGLLTYDGNTWGVYRLPDKSPLNRVTFFKDTVYTQGPASKGYWLPDGYGGMTYHPLKVFPPGVNFDRPVYEGALPPEMEHLTLTAWATAGDWRLTGTATDGIFLSTKKGEELLHLSTQNQLQDNIVRALCVQDVNMVWVALDNGISQIELDPSVTLMGRRSVIGKLQEALLCDDTLYVRTNVGYFKRSLVAGRRFTPFSAEEGAHYFPSAGQETTDEETQPSLSSLFTDLSSLEGFAEAEGVYATRDSMYWLTAGNEAGLFHCTDGAGVLKCRILFDNYSMNLVTSGRRVFPLNDSLDLVSTMQGALLVNTRRLISGGLGGLTMPRFRQIGYTDADGSHALHPDTTQIVLPHSFQQLTVRVGTTIFTPHHQISYKLEGVSTEWSPWQKDGKISLLQLPEGKYELRVRKYVVKGPYPEISLAIEVRPPWYNTIWAYLVYLFLIWLIGRTAIKHHLRNLRREEQSRQEAERQAEQQKLQEMKSEMLEAELQNKNNELLLQTSALVKRNQAIQSFLDELERQKETLGDRYPNKLYNKMRGLMEETLNDQAGWLQFETYFNGAHQDFMDRLRREYADITTGDLRICCLLRMNLSTKEIASLLNISVRAVELRRYRLRKRLGLDGETNLVDFLMSF